MHYFDFTFRVAGIVEGHGARSPSYIGRIKMNIKELRNHLEKERSKVFLELVNERGAVNRDFIFSLVIQLRGINNLIKIIDETNGSQRDYTG